MGKTQTKHTIQTMDHTLTATNQQDSQKEHITLTQWVAQSRNRLASGQLKVNKNLLIITCIDPRINLEHLFKLQPSDAAVIRNAGARITGEVTEDIVIATEILKIGNILHLHHTDCLARQTSPGQAKQKAGREDMTFDALNRIPTIGHSAQTLKDSGINAYVIEAIYNVESGKVVIVGPNKTPER